MFASKSRCFRCGEPKPRGAGMVGNGPSSGVFSGGGSVTGYGAAASRAGGSSGAYGSVSNAASALSGVSGYATQGAPPGSVGRKRGGWDDRAHDGDVKRSRFDDPPGGGGGMSNGPPSGVSGGGGGWRGVVKSDPPPRGSSQFAPPAAPPDPNGIPAPPPGMGVVSQRSAAAAAAAAARPAPPAPPPPSAPASRTPSLPRRRPDVAANWKSPLTESFSEDVRAMMDWAMVRYRDKSHPLFIPGANYDRLVAKLSNSVVEKEQAQWKEGQSAIDSGALETRMKAYVQSQVEHMHAQHLQNGGGR